MSILQAVSLHLDQVFSPMLNHILPSYWGNLAGKTGQTAKFDFLGQITNFISVLNEAQLCIEEKVVLKPCEKYDLSEVVTVGDYLSVSNNSDALYYIEETVRSWMKQIQILLAESEQIRKEADNIGPRAELEYWKRRTSKFNYLLEQLKEQYVKAALGVLQVAKSRLILKWRDVDSKITNCANEARDNVRYLYTLEKFCDPLYNSDPVTMLPGIPGLVNAIRMIYSISGYYNTSERMTSLFLKVTNQMITACKLYITERETVNVWNQPNNEAIKKLQDCIRLNQEYQSCFQKTKEALAKSPDEKHFDFSEVYIFGKFDQFIKRIEKILDVYDVIATYSKLQENRIDGNLYF